MSARTKNKWIRVICWVAPMAAGLVLAIPDTVNAAAVYSKIGRSEMIGVGFAVGTPTGVTLNFWIARDMSIATTFAYAAKGEVLTGTVDGLYRIRNLLHFGNQIEVGIHVGGGLGVDLSNFSGGGDGKNKKGGGVDVAMTVRIVGGAALMFRSVPIEVYAELVPRMPVYPDLGDIDIQGTIGGRYYF